MRVLAVLFLATAVLAKHELYQGWKSYYVGGSTQEQLEIFNSIRELYEVILLSPPIISREGLVLVKPEYQDAFTKTMAALNITLRTHVEDVKVALDQDDENIDIQRKVSMTRNGGRQIPYDNYQNLDVIYDYLQDIATRYPDTVTLVTPANSFEGRPIHYLKISTTNFEDTSKPVIFIDATMHAREWITTPVATWAIHKLVENVTEPDLLEKFDWILLPVANPDGYAFTFDSERFWRKTRSTNRNPLSFLCRGVDGNRNFDFVWNTVGVDSSVCSDIYPGNQAFSEIETQVVRDIVKEYLPRMAMYITLHSFGSMILYPWGHDGTLSNNALALHTVGIAMAHEIDNNKLPNFPNYVVGNGALVLNYQASGASEDWVHSVGVPLSYTLELPGFGFGFDGFHLSPIYIQQVAIETWKGIAVGARRASELFNGIIVP